jgi:hypothetical protein
VLALVVGWLCGGGIGQGRLRTVGASPWQFGLAVGLEMLAAGAVTLGAAAGWAGVRAFVATVRAPGETPVLWAPTSDPDAVTERLDGLYRDRPAAAAERADEADGGGLLAG